MTKNERWTSIAFIWHGFFLALTVSMLDLNTVFPTLVQSMTQVTIVFGALYSMMLGIPLIFNIVFSHHLQKVTYKKKFLIFGIFLRSFAFLGMALMTYYFAQSHPKLTLGSYFLFVFLFSISAGFAGISYSDIIGKMIHSRHRTSLYSIKQFFGSSASFIGGVIIARIFDLGIAYPLNYTISLLIGAIGLVIASSGFFFIKEPPSVELKKQPSFIEYVKEIPHILKTDQSFKRYIWVENLSSFSIMILPFYIIYAQSVFVLDNRFIGVYLMIQVSGTIFSNIVWGILAKRFEAKTVVLVCILLGGLNPIVALFLGQTSPVVYGIVFFILGFTISGRRVGFEPFLLDLSPTEKRIQYLGIRGSLNVLVVLLPLLGALFIETIGFVVTFLMVTVVMMIAAMMLRRIDPNVIDTLGC